MHHSTLVIEPLLAEGHSASQDLLHASWSPCQTNCCGYMHMHLFEGEGEGVLRALKRSGLTKKCEVDECHVCVQHKPEEFACKTTACSELLHDEIPISGIHNLHAETLAHKHQATEQQTRTTCRSASCSGSSRQDTEVMYWLLFTACATILLLQCLPGTRTCVCTGEYDAKRQNGKPNTWVFPRSPHNNTSVTVNLFLPSPGMLEDAHNKTSSPASRWNQHIQ